MARYDLNIYTRLCEILNIYIWGYISIRGDRERWGEEKDREDCVEGREVVGRERGKRTKKEGYHKDIPLIRVVIMF